jgi:thiamine-phosphate pyrophosphorylase
MLAAEQGADYVMFGEPDVGGRRLAFETIEERVAWWAEVFEAPCVAFAGGIDEIGPLVATGADFVALGDWIWTDAVAQVREAARRLAQPETTA